MAQKAAIEALQSGRAEVNHMVEQYDERRKYIVTRLNEIGLKCFEPKGAFYVFPSIQVTGMSSEEFTEKLLEEEKVAVVPGTAFGESGEGHIRISYASSLENIKEALNKIDNFVKKYL